MKTLLKNHAALLVLWATILIERRPIAMFTMVLLSILYYAVWKGWYQW